MTDLCRELGISRTVGYKYLHRFEEYGFEGLLEISRSPKNCPTRVPRRLEAEIVKLRQEHEDWGAEKLLAHLQRYQPCETWPAISTVNLILSRNNLVVRRQHRRHILPSNPIFDPKANNEIWSADFKGKYLLRCQHYCHTLTVADSFNRYLIAADCFYSPSTYNTIASFTRIFRDYGTPLQLHTDNGVPFGCATALGRLTQFSVWLLEHGVEPVYSDPGHPEQNGRHERMHRDLKARATNPPAYDLKGQQTKVDAFRKEYNEVRPHKAINNLTPVDLFEPSPRKFEETVRSWDYPEGFDVRLVCRNGAVRQGSHQWIMVSTALIGKYVGFEEVGNGISRVFYRHKFLGYLDEATWRIQDDKGRHIRGGKV